MRRIETVEKRLRELSAKHDVTAGELAKDLGLSRANVSSDLNRLCKEGTAEKRGGKPVYYKAAVHIDPDGTLEQFLQNNPSLFHCMEQAKASVLYPPHGMHMLLLGETGVGKSMLAELIYRYAGEKGCLSADAAFIAFNCADYANNPQLLVSQLMGTKKGAYTGADSDRAGLLEKADGGILFLDEVHRLPPEGQEMLFTFIDRGVYRRLGETDADRSASVLLICATSENIESSLLTTFVRRIPMIIRVPNLEERSLDERLNLISGFFLKESARLGKPIHVSVNSIRSLLCYKCPYNIGQLKNDIMILCAKAYSEYRSGKKRDLSIVSADLPQNIREGLYLETSHRQVWSRFVGINGRFCVFDSSAQTPPRPEEEDADSIYDLIDSQVKKLKAAGAAADAIDREISRDIRLYFEKYAETPDNPQSLSRVESLVGPAVLRVTDQILKLAAEKLNRSFSDNVRCGVALHIFNAIRRVGRGQKIVNPQINSIRKNSPNEFSAALGGLELIGRELGVAMPIDEAGFLSLFLSLNGSDADTRAEKVQIVVIAHGSSTATSMAEAANRLIGMNHAFGLDASLSESPRQVYLRLKDHLKDHPAGGGVLLLVDMGSLTNFSADLQNELGIPVKLIPLVSTPHVIEAVRKAVLGYSLDEVYSDTLNVNEWLNESESFRKSDLAKMFILTVCTTGEGSAALLKRVLDSRLRYHDSMCETIAVRLADRADLRERLSAVGGIGKIICTVSSFDLGQTAPNFGVNEVLDGSAVPKIQKIIDQEAVFLNIDQTLENMLKNVDHSGLSNDIRASIDKIQSSSGIRITFDELIGVFLHIGCMIDRLAVRQQAAAFPRKKEYIAAHPELFQTVRTACRFLEHNYRIQIPDDEICYIALCFDREKRKREST